MPARQYYCWKLALKYHCGCLEYTSTQHVCNSNKGIECHRWMITRSTDKNCDSHRISGLHGAGDSQTDDQGQLEDQNRHADDTSTDQQRTVPGEEYLASGSWEQGPRRRAAA
ncbi:hypothetical protein B0T14DRAFT_216553 [Immersiella caudata]|uniref:Uncharacterized protein n=1 Tax=Immersiella caudata TaxID=314043 RepID=A0AA39WQQ0_9PEZI|nr:hypothetical protein B0T14DRAFT_216553 [Immersiella caudata]